MRMKLATICVLSALYQALALPTWPSSIDELEDIMLLNTGYRARAFSAQVTPCSFSQHGPSRIASAEWLRTAFHDMAPGNIFTGVGGLDASIVFELGGNGGENIGTAFNTTLETFTPFFSSRASMADIIALGVYTAVRSCGGPIVKTRGGRIDARSGGPVGVPLPENSQGTFINQFARTGFNVSDMIAVTACGHTLGGVHAGNFPQIVIPGTVPNDYALLDDTSVFDEKIATDFVNNANIDPLTSNFSRRNTRDADTKVFTADKNLTITALTDPATFQSTCARVLQKMVEVVPAGVTLTDVIEPYEVKPGNLQLSLLDAESLEFSGEIRVRTTVRLASQIASVKIVFKDRDGNSDCGSCEIDAQHRGDGAGFDDSFAFYGFSSTLSVHTSISSFVVQITSTSGETETYDNNGSGYPVQDIVLLQREQSYVNENGAPSGKSIVNIVAAVRDTVESPAATLKLTMKTPRKCCVVPALTTASVSMAKQGAVGVYMFYNGSYVIDLTQKPTTKFDISVGSGTGKRAVSFQSTADLGATCDPFVSNSSQPSYSYSGCFTDQVASRTLTGSAYKNDSMTIAQCSDLCGEKYQFFGLEYGIECYCGNTRSAGSDQVADSECAMACGGDNTKICGDSNRLSIFNNTRWIPTVNPTIDGYKFQGCYNDSSSSRALSDSFQYNTKMTAEYCASFCGGANYFGLEYYSECYCGRSLLNTSTLQPETDCSYFCSGNSTQYCGGSNRIDVYAKES